MYSPPGTDEGIDFNRAIKNHKAALGIDTVRNPLLDAAYESAWGDIDIARVPRMP